MNKKEIQKKRMMGYFIEATNKIIEEEGIEGVTIRKVADLAGYNSATLYNYFKDLDHLLFFASMKYLKDYVFDLPNYIKESKNTLDRYLKLWRCFCLHSFSKPKIYYTIFLDKYRDHLNEAVEEYYSIFPEELDDDSFDLFPTLLENNFYARDMGILKACVSEGIFKKEDIKEINELIQLIYQGMLLKVLNNPDMYTAEETTDKTIKYIEKIINTYK